MAIASSGAISLAGDIGEELGNNNATTTTTLKVASNGGIDTINSASASKPDGTAPHSMSEFYSYDHSASSASVPTSNLFFRIDPNDTNCYSGSGTTVNDLGSFGLTGTLYNGASWSSNGYFTFDGTNDYLQFPNGTDLIVPSTTAQRYHELYFWARPHQITNANMIAVSTDDQSSSRRTYQVKYKSNGTFGPAFIYSGNSVVTTFSSHSMSANQWYLIRYQHRYVGRNASNTEVWHKKYNASSWTKLADSSKTQQYQSYSSDICIGAQEKENSSSTANNPYNGDIGDVLMYYDTHSTDPLNLSEADDVFDATKASYGG